MARGISTRRVQRGLQSVGISLASLAAGAAIAGSLGGAWMLGTHLASRADVRPIALRTADVPATFAERAAVPERASFAERAAISERASFSDRFAASGAKAVASSTAPAAQDTQVVALFDPSPSLGTAPGAFRKRLPASPAGWSVASAPAQVAEAPTTRVAAPKQVALNLPAAPRPSLTLPEPSGSPHERLVQRATARLLTAAASGKPSIFEKLLGKLQPSGPVLAYAGPDSGTPGLSPSLAASTSAIDRVTAVYDITKHVVYMPDGSKLEAHSGLGSRLDDPDYAHERMRGVTPPHIYDLKPREALFHGVPALRMTPIGGEAAVHGRSGLLAHTYMLGPKGDSNGCISFKDYYAFLKAYRDGDVKRIVVVDKI